MLGLDPIGENLIVDPALPAGIGHLELLDVRGRWGRIDAFGHGRVDLAKRSQPIRAELGEAATARYRRWRPGAPIRRGAA
jgi:hypothetical protein